MTYYYSFCLPLVLMIMLTLLCSMQREAGTVLSVGAQAITLPEMPQKHYIIYMGEHWYPNSHSVVAANHQMLAAVIGSLEGAERATIHHYSKSFRGFSAMLTPEQAEEIAEKDSVISVFESRMNRALTTHSWDFLGVPPFPQYDQLPPMNEQSNLIVGVIDSGVWPESESFNDYGMPPIPKKFKGECIPGDEFLVTNCNRKIIGARYYWQGFEADARRPLESFGRPFFRSARDSEGHGSHTASTVGGSVVPNVGLFQIARGTARGGAPATRLAIYKACWFDVNCSSADVLAAFDAAIHDGVDIISLSLGPFLPPPIYFQDAYSIGAFHAFKRGILVSAAAGNDGASGPGTAVNVAPWILTVAASSVDRKLDSNVILGNLQVLKGTSLNPLIMDNFTPLVFGTTAAAPGFPARSASLCRNGSLDASLITGKILVCIIDVADPAERATFVRQAGGAGIIFIHDILKDWGAAHFPIPATIINQADGVRLTQYIDTEQNPVAKIDPTVTVLFTKPAPEMAVFSSRGPNVITPEIIKPDITAPGLNILAAWSPVSTANTAGRRLKYNIDYGTSMACPHISAVAAVIKSFHPSWRPAAIMSAIMTTATTRDNTGDLIKRQPDGRRATPFDYGSGHVNPIAALNPGLVYEFDSNDIIRFLCSTVATPAQLISLTGGLMECENPQIPSYNFNYPSIGVSNMVGDVSLYRTVTYYCDGPTIYSVYVEEPSGVRVRVTPSKLVFEKTGEKLSFKVDLSPYNVSGGGHVFGSLTWSNGVHVVRSPIGVNVVSVL